MPPNRTLRLLMESAVILLLDIHATTIMFRWFPLLHFINIRSSSQLPHKYPSKPHFIFKQIMESWPSCRKVYSLLLWPMFHKGRTSIALSYTQSKYLIFQLTSCNICSSAPARYRGHTVVYTGTELMRGGYRHCDPQSPVYTDYLAVTLLRFENILIVDSFL